MSNSTGIIIIVILLILIKYCANPAGLAVNKNQIIRGIIDDKSLFISGDYNKLRNKHSWMDAGIYNDARMLIRQNKFDKKNLQTIFRKEV